MLPRGYGPGFVYSKQMIPVYAVKKYSGILRTVVLINVGQRFLQRELLVSEDR